MNKPLDIFICAYLRPMFTEQTLIYLKERTKYPYRLFLINNGGNDDIARVYKDDIFMTINMSRNAGVTAAWQIALALAESDYFITSDNDIYVPDLRGYGQSWQYPDGDELEPRNPISSKLEDFTEDTFEGECWLTQLVKFMDERPEYAAISLHPHVFVGIHGEDPNDPEDVKEAPMCGAVMRIMRRDAVRKVNGWADEGDMPLIRGDRGHEERTICSRLQSAGYKTGRTTRLRAYHPFGTNWGYPQDFTPEQQGHNPELADYVKQFDQMEAYDERTWLPKT